MIKLTVKVEEQILLEMDGRTRKALALLLGKMSVLNFKKYGATQEQADLLLELYKEIS